MASSTSKKVQVHRFDRELLAGFVNPNTFLTSTGLELLSLNGMVSAVPITDVKAVCFVKDFDGRDIAADRRAFLARPKMDGLWIRMKFRDADILEGVLPNNLLQVESAGFTVIPPDFTANNQRVFVPRAALVEVQVLGVVGSPLRQASRKKARPADKTQIGLFE